MAAIYMWVETDIQVYTTTLYPIEAAEGLLFSIDLDYGDMRTIPNDSYVCSGTFETAFFTEILLLGPTPEDNYVQSGTFEDAYTVEILLLGPTPEDDYICSGTFEDAILRDLLITAYKPDHGLLMTIDLDYSNCSMVDV